MPAKKKPTTLKLLEGERGKRAAVNTEAPTPNPTAPTCPESASPEVKELWERVCGELERLKLLSIIDGTGLAMALGHAALAEKALAELLKANVAENDSVHGGTLKKHPAAQIFRDNSDAFLKWAQEFGLTPAARSKMALPQEDDSTFERMSQPNRASSH